MSLCEECYTELDAGACVSTIRTRLLWSSLCVCVKSQSTVHSTPERRGVSLVCDVAVLSAHHHRGPVVTVCPLGQISGLARRSMRQSQWKLAKKGTSSCPSHHTMIGHRHPPLFTQNTVVSCGLGPVPVVQHLSGTLVYNVYILRIWF